MDKFRIVKRPNNKYIIQRKFLMFWYNIVNASEIPKEYNSITEAEGVIKQLCTSDVIVKEIHI